MAEFKFAFNCPVCGEKVVIVEQMRAELNGSKMVLEMAYYHDNPRSRECEAILKVLREDQERTLRRFIETQQDLAKRGMFRRS